MDWTSPERYETIAYPDVNGDGRADLCGRASYGLLCGLDTGTEFDLLTAWATGLDDANGWYAPQNYKTFRYADLNADGMEDVCARANNGLYCGLSNGSSFLDLTLWANLSMGVAWFEPAGYTTLQLPDLNNDGRADLCIRGHDGLMCALSDGAAFGSLDLWSDTFSDENGWTNVDQYATLRFPDLNGDGMADVCGRASDGIRCALSNGTTYGTANVWQAQLSDANGWTLPKHYETIDYADIDGDGTDDLCARSKDGAYCALREGTSFAAGTLWSNAFANGTGWGAVQHYSTLHHPDLDGDGRADICGRGPTGMLCGLSNGSAFAVSLWSPDFSDAQGFDGASSYTTLRTPVLDPDTCP